MKGKILIAVRGTTASAREFAEAWQRSDHDRRPAQPVERLYFEDLATLLKVLTPARLEVLKTVHKVGPVSVRAVATKLQRDYKNVHHDLKVLERVGLVIRLPDGKLTAPYEKIVAEFALAA